MKSYIKKESMEEENTSAIFLAVPCFLACFKIGEEIIVLTFANFRILLDSSLRISKTESRNRIQKT